MTYPRIYSLSTVGVLKHYIHDYLLHPLRTDFIGPNGVGKSIIADLLQLMFIYDTDLIKFGTDGVQQGKRSIYKLPYSSNIAYCVLNIEVEENKFIIIGIVINAQVSTRIMPFVITKNSDLSRSLNDLTLTKEQLLMAKDFLSANKTIPVLKVLSSELFQNKNLYLTYFKNKEEVNKYYQFLYEKGILSINLSTGKNLKAFAKVIQSFSKAKTLDLRPANASRSLKDFLFEDSDSELLEDYSSQQHILDKLLREYASLDKYIKILEQKQKGLSEVKRLNDEAGLKKRLWMEGSLSDMYKNLILSSAKEKELVSSLENEKKLKEKLHKDCDRLPKIQTLIEEAIETANKNYEVQVKYEKVIGEIAEIEKEITELKLLNCLKLLPDWKNDVEKIDIALRSSKLIKEALQFARPFIDKYKTLAKIESARITQENSIQQLQSELDNELEDTDKLIKLLSDSTKESFIQWVVNENKPLDHQQGSILLHFARVSTTKKYNPQKGDRYLNPEELLFKSEVNTEGKKGFWLKLGAIDEFIEFDSEAKMFDNPKNFHHSISQFLQKLEGIKKEIQSKLAEIQNVRKAKNYNRSIIKNEFDLGLIEYSNIDRIKEAASCVLQLGEKVNQLEDDKETKEQQLQVLLFSLPVNAETQDPELLKQELQKIRRRQNDRNVKFGKYTVRVREKLNTTEGNILRVTDQLFELRESILTEQESFNKLNTEYFDAFSKNLTIEDLSQDYDNPKTLELEFLECVQLYQVKYHTAISQFEETKDGKSIPVNMEIQSKSYSFRVLEESLLGNKIKHTDEIAAALNDANAARLNMADELKNSMVKIFDKTLKRYKIYKELVQHINSFFKGRKISERFFFKVDFSDNPTIRIDFVEEIGTRLRNAAKQGELPFDKPVSEFIEEFFKRAGKLSEKMPIAKLLSPKTYFDLSVKLTDETENEIPGSTGEAYSAIALLGIARLSLVQKEQRQGIRFIILEEIGSLDNSNFNTFPAIAKEYGYQIITMAPHPFRTSLSDEWYAHHLIKGNVDANINFHPSASYFKTKDRSQDLSMYLKLAGNELDRTKSIT